MGRGKSTLESNELDFKIGKEIMDFKHNQITNKFVAQNPFTGFMEYVMFVPTQTEEHLQWVKKKLENDGLVFEEEPSEGKVIIHYQEQVFEGETWSEAFLGLVKTLLQVKDRKGRG